MIKLYTFQGRLVTITDIISDVNIIKHPSNYHKYSVLPGNYTSMFILVMTLITQQCKYKVLSFIT